MAANPQIPDPICTSLQVPELGKFSFAIQFRGERRDAFLVRFKGMVYGYLNECAHMLRPLDCEQAHIFDESGQYLQCSMHGIQYDPKSGEALSDLCAGKKLTALKVREEEGWVYLVDKRSILDA